MCIGIVRTLYVLEACSGTRWPSTCGAPAASVAHAKPQRVFFLCRRRRCGLGWTKRCWILLVTRPTGRASGRSCGRSMRACVAACAMCVAGVRTAHVADVQDVFRAPVAIRECAHLFCSACIRMHINQAGGSGAFCPSCRQKKAYDAELVPQPALEAAADNWRTARCVTGPARPG